MIRVATLPELYDRTITIGSAGKTFSVTGWKLGWVKLNNFKIKIILKKIKLFLSRL